MPGPDIAAPKSWHPTRGVVIDVGPDEHIFGVDDQLHRNRHIPVAYGVRQCAKEVGAVNLQAVGGVRDERVGPLALLRWDTGCDEPRLIARARKVRMAAGMSTGIENPIM